MALAPLRRSGKPEPLIALINIVFLMLIFFLVAAAIAPPLDDGIVLARTDRIDGRAPPYAAIVRPDGTLVYRGAEVSAAGYLAIHSGPSGDTALRLVPDRDLPARELVRIAADLRLAGATEVWIVTERGLR